MTNHDTAPDDEVLFSEIADDIETKGYSIRPRALPASMCACLLRHQHRLPEQAFQPAGIGRHGDHQVRPQVRSDQIAWLTNDSSAGRRWNRWASRMQRALNRRLFLGLSRFESHWAHYRPGTRYQRHHDAFRGDTSRVLSLVAYFNRDWHHAHGGQLVLYRDANDQRGQRILPEFGTLVIFLSEEFPHEVLSATRDRHSVAGWFRVD